MGKLLETLTERILEESISISTWKNVELDDTSYDEGYADGIAAFAKELRGLIEKSQLTGNER